MQSENLWTQSYVLAEVPWEIRWWCGQELGSSIKKGSLNIRDTNLSGKRQDNPTWNTMEVHIYKHWLFCVNLILARLPAAQLPRTIKHFDSKCTLLSRCNSIRIYTTCWGTTFVSLRTCAFMQRTVSHPGWTDVSKEGNPKDLGKLWD